MFQHSLGDKVRDRVTSYDGIVTARTEYLNGCIRYGVQRDKLTKDGKPQESEWFDENQLVTVRAKAVKVKIKRTGGPAAKPRLPANPK